MDFINTGILKQPMNWILIWLIFILGAFGLHFLLTLIHGQQWPSDQKSHRSLLR